MKFGGLMGFHHEPIRAKADQRGQLPGSPHSSVLPGAVGEDGFPGSGRFDAASDSRRWRDGQAQHRTHERISGR